MMNILQRFLVTLLALTSTLVVGSVSITYAATTLDANQYVIFYHSDLLGSPAVVTDHNGNTLWHEHSDPYGRARPRVTETRKVLDHDRVGSRKGYTRHLKDEGSNLVYMKARFYDPQIGRFYSNDPIGFSASNPSMFNRYSYVRNSPYRYTDPTGSILEYPDDFDETIKKVEETEIGKEVVDNLRDSDNTYTIRTPTFMEKVGSFLEGNWGNVAGFESGPLGLGGTIILTPGVRSEVAVVRYNDRDPSSVIFSADATMFHELGHAHYQDITGITDGVYGGQRQSERDIHRVYDLKYTGFLRKPSLFPRFLGPE